MRTVVEQPVVEQPIVQQSIVEQPAVQQPAVQQPPVPVRNGAELVAANAANGQNNDAQNGGRSWFDIKLIIKLIFLVFILCQSSTMSHTLFISGIAAVVYLQQVGIIRYILEGVGAVGVQRDGANVVPAAGGDVAAGGAAGGGQDNNAAVAAAPQVPDVPQGNIPHAATGGFMTDMYTFFMCLVLSLVPSWAPRPMQEPVPPQQPVPQLVQ